MRKLLLIMILSFVFVTSNANAVNNKKLAFFAVKQFFNLKQAKLTLEGRFIDTAPEYGYSCKINVDFSKVDNEYLSIVGEYTPAGNIGDGLYFNADKSTFLFAKLLNKQLILEQKLTDSFSTGTKTMIKLSKKNNTLRFSIYQQSYFLFIPQKSEKTCLVENYVQ